MLGFMSDQRYQNRKVWMERSLLQMVNAFLYCLGIDNLVFSQTSVDLFGVVASIHVFHQWFISQAHMDWRGHGQALLPGTNESQKLKKRSSCPDASRNIEHTSLLEGELSSTIQNLLPPPRPMTWMMSAHWSSTLHFASAKVLETLQFWGPKSFSSISFSFKTCMRQVDFFGAHNQHSKWIKSSNETLIPKPW